MVRRGGDGARTTVDTGRVRIIEMSGSLAAGGASGRWMVDIG